MASLISRALSGRRRPCRTLYGYAHQVPDDARKFIDRAGNEQGICLNAGLKLVQSRGHINVMPWMNDSQTQAQVSRSAKKILAANCTVVQPQLAQILPKNLSRYVIVSDRSPKANGRDGALQIMRTERAKLKLWSTVRTHPFHECLMATKSQKICHPTIL